MPQYYYKIDHNTSEKKRNEDLGAGGCMALTRKREINSAGVSLFLNE